MFSHTKRRYCKFFDYWKYSLKDGTYFVKEDSDEKQRRVVSSTLLLKKTYLNSTISANGFRGLLAGASCMLLTVFSASGMANANSGISV